MELSDIKKLSAILQENGDKILDGTSKLSMSINLLQYLNESFNLIIDEKDLSSPGVFSAPPTTFQVIHTSNSRLEIFRDLQFLHDFIQKAIGLKVTNYSNILAVGPLEQFEGTADISKFRSLKLLEIRKVPIHYLTGIAQLRSHIQCIICVKSLTKQNLDEILIECGADGSKGFLWSELREATFTHNNLRTVQSKGLNLVPFLQVLDLSHNKLKDAGSLEVLHNLKHLNLSFNQLERLPLFSQEQSNKLQSIAIKNNYIDDLSGLATLISLRELDVSCNCLVDHSTLAAIPILANLQILSLEGNPLSYHPHHRKLTSQYLHSNTASVKFLLDRNLLSSSERMLIGTYHTKSTRLPGYLQERRNEIFNTSLNTSYYGDISSDASTSTPIGSTTPENQSKSRGRTPRKPSRRMRQAIISDDGQETDDFENKMQMSYSENSFPRESSFESSIEHLSTKRQIEDLREKYGDYWLHSKGGSSHVQDVLGMEKTPIPINNWYVDEQNQSDTSLPNSPNSLQTIIPENESEYKTIGDEPATSELTTELTTDYNSVLETSYQSTETTTEVEEIEDDKFDVEEEDSDVNSVLYIVQLERTAGQFDQFLLCISVVSKIIRERNSITGLTKEKWPLSILESCESTETGVILKFDTVKRDKQTRTYVIEDEKDRQSLVDLLRSVLDSRSLKDMNQLIYRCMRCSLEFTSERPDKTRIGNSDNESALQCVSCKSTIIMEVDDDSKVPIPALISTREVTPEQGEFALPHSPSHSSIANIDERPSTGVFSPRLLKVTADVHAPATNSQANNISTLLQPCSATSLDDSLTSSRISAADSSTKRGDSDIEVLTDPSQDSIEVLAVLARGASLTPKRKHSVEESSKLDSVTSLLKTVTEKTKKPALEIIPSNLIMSTIAAGLTESSSSDSLTDSICTAYETRATKSQENGATSSSSTLKPNESNNVVMVDEEQIEVELSEPKEAEQVLGVGIISSMLEGLWNAGNILSLSPSKTITNKIPPNNVDNVEFSYNDFTQIDHRIKLHLYLNIFDEETEEVVWLIRAEILTHYAEQPFSGCVVFSTKKIYVLKIDNVVLGDEPQEWLKKHESYKSEQLKTIFTLPWKQGLGIEIRQVSLMGAESSVYILCFLQDLMRTTNFLAYLYSSQLPDTCDLVTKTSERTALNLQQLLLSTASQPDSDFQIRLFHILSHCEIKQGFHSEENIQELKMSVMIITACDIILTQDSLIWLQPESTQTPLISTTQQISNIVEVERSGFTIEINFLDESVGKEESWVITTVSTNAIDGIIDAIRKPWESLFSVTLQVKSIEVAESLEEVVNE